MNILRRMKTIVENIKTKNESKSESELREISIWIDNYDDIFSDFDPRPFSERNISDDFLYEVKKISKENNFHINELKLLIPEKERNTDNETVIIKRLHSHFRRNHHLYQEQVKFQNKKGIFLTLLGTVMMIIASYISFVKSENFMMRIFLVILEPAGWFLVWTGLDNLISSSKDKKTELEFYNKMSKTKIAFISI